MVSVLRRWACSRSMAISSASSERTARCARPKPASRRMGTERRLLIADGFFATPQPPTLPSRAEALPTPAPRGPRLLHGLALTRQILAPGLLALLQIAPLFQRESHGLRHRGQQEIKRLHHGILQDVPGEVNTQRQHPDGVSQVLRVLGIGQAAHVLTGDCRGASTEQARDE